MKYYLKAMEKEVIIGSDLSEIAHITSFVKELGNSLQLSSDVTMDISLALEEAIANIIKHAYLSGEQNEIRLKICVLKQEILFTLIDNGISFNPLTTEEMWTVLSQEQNFFDKMGINLIRQIMDEVTYSRNGDQNLLCMKKKLDVEIQTEQTIKINVCKIEGVTILTIEGRLDTLNAREFDAVIQPLVAGDAPSIIINCENFSYISSSGIRSLIMLQKNVSKKNGRLVLEAMKPEIRKIFDMTGCSSIFTIR